MKLLVLNDDTIICQECYEEEHPDSAPELDPGRVSFAETALGICQSCGASDADERCDLCGELRSPDQFEDGLRCKLCAEADAETTDEQEIVTPRPRMNARF